MNRYPYRVRSLRTNDSTTIAGEKTHWVEEAHSVCIWRLSDTEFLIEKISTDSAQPMISSRTKPGYLGNVFMSQVRDMQLYAVGEKMPWPDHVEPGAVVDSNDAMLSALTAPAAKAKQGKQTGLGV